LALKLRIFRKKNRWGHGYDANGNITTENAWTYVYDLSNQLVTVLNNSNQAAAYTYNGAGQRIKKVTQTETRIFHYDLRGHLIAETNQTGQAIAEYIYLGDTLLSMIKPGETVYYYHNDHLGTPQGLTNDSQAIAWKAVYTPFGEAVPSIQTVDNPFRFPGQYYDPETGLHYNYFRYYNPQTGRYITPDPIGLEGGINLFVYVQNNPVNRTDEFGLQSVGAEEILLFYYLSELSAELLELSLKVGKNDYAHRQCKELGGHQLSQYGSIIDWSKIDWNKWDQGTFEKTLEKILTEVEKKKSEKKKNEKKNR